MTETCAAPGCANPRPPAPATGGVQPKYCSDACRKRAARLRKKSVTPTSEIGTPVPDLGHPSAGPVALAWKPVIPPRPVPPPEEDPGACPGCGTATVLMPRGTQAACAICRVLRIPPKALRAHTVQAGERQVVPESDRDEAGRDLYGTVQELLDAIAAEVAAGELTSGQRGRLDWYAEELKEARKRRDGARVAKLAADLDAEDLGVTVYGSEAVLDGEVVYDSAEEIEVSPADYRAITDDWWRVLSPGPRLGIGAGQARPATPDRRNPAERWRDSRTHQQQQPGEPTPQVRHLPPDSASSAAPPIQAVPATAAPGNGDEIAALIEAGATGAQLVAYALGRDPDRPHVPPAGRQAVTRRRIVPLSWRARRAIAS